ncbi:hypothetical protein E6H21_00825 [Candidatus Bathyarchaeota archaeon]|nr:MAG: hypothetical protein E6H21_00825 [Candidatus Bathyarchaeota archaeon]
MHGPGLALVSAEAAAKVTSEAKVRRGKDGFPRTYFAVFVDDADREYEELRAKGVHFVKPPTTFPWGQRMAYFEDPEGNLWEISHFLKK